MIGQYCQLQFLERKKIEIGQNWSRQVRLKNRTGPVNCNRCTVWTEDKRDSKSWGWVTFQQDHHICSLGMDSSSYNAIKYLLGTIRLRSTPPTHISPILLVLSCVHVMTLPVSPQCSAAVESTLARFAAVCRSSTALDWMCFPVAYITAGNCHIDSVISAVHASGVRDTFLHLSNDCTAHRPYHHTVYPVVPWKLSSFKNPPPRQS